jgi:hypothetical protein
MSLCDNDSVYMFMGKEHNKRATTDGLRLYRRLHGKGFLGSGTPMEVCELEDKSIYKSILGLAQFAQMTNVNAGSSGLSDQTRDGSVVVRMMFGTHQENGIQFHVASMTTPLPLDIDAPALLLVLRTVQITLREREILTAAYRLLKVKVGMTLGEWNATIEKERGIWSVLLRIAAHWSVVIRRQGDTEHGSPKAAGEDRGRAWAGVRSCHLSVPLDRGRRRRCAAPTPSPDQVAKRIQQVKPTKSR